ncbi:Sodium-dependent phosphate transport protein 1 [Aphelenchoides fujianensis]|nr:Sodium-dependent phosphate transport protein 1 [Aphelenchoides fujianensis]
MVKVEEAELPIAVIDSKTPAAPRRIPPSGCTCGGYTRFLIVLVSMAYLTAMTGNSVALNFTVICMYKDEAEGTSAPMANSTSPPQLQPMFSETQMSWLFSIVALGTICGTVPTSWLQTRVGMRSGWSIASAFPAIGAIISEWATWEHSGTYTSYLSSYLQLGPIITMPLAGAMCESAWGWSSLYYVQGAATLLAMLLFFWFYRDSAADHPNVNDAELALLRKDKVTKRSEKRAAVPVRAIATDPVVLNFHVQSTGWASAIPPIASVVVKLLAGPLSDHIPRLSARWRLILFASVSQFAEAVCFVVLALLPASQPVWTQFFLTAAVAFSALNCVGVWKATQLVCFQSCIRSSACSFEVSGPFSYVLMAVNQLLASFGILILPPIVATWARLLYGMSVFMCATTVVFNVTAKGDPRRDLRRIGLV